MNTSTLQRHSVLSGVTPDLISEFANRRIARHQVRPCGRPGAATGYLHHATFGNVSLSNLGFGTETVIEGSDALDAYYLQMVMAGRLDVAFVDGAFTVDTRSMVIINPFHRVELHHSAECCALVVRIQREVVQQHLTNFLGRTTAGAIEFSPLVRLEDPRIGSLARTIEHICLELEDPYSTIHAGTVCRSFESLLMDTFLCAVPHSHSSKVEQVVVKEGPEHLLRAERFIEDNMGSDISLEDIVAAAATSERNLYKAFEAYRGTTPMKHLKWHRLRMARRELESFHNPTKTVADVAMWVGMPHLGNFAADYRRCFGELPSETLRRRNQALPA